MSIVLKYKCGCEYFHDDDDNIHLFHACTDHKIDLANDALNNYSKRVKLGTSSEIRRKVTNE